MPSLTAAERKRKLANANRKKARLDRKKIKAATDTAAVEELPVDPKLLEANIRKPAGHIKQARENLVAAFDLIGGVPALVKWGKLNLTEFYRIWARLIPKEAAEEQNNSLETLLAMLAVRGDQPVAEAAYEIGVEKMMEGKEGADLEDAAALFAQTQGTMQ